MKTIGLIILIIGSLGLGSFALAHGGVEKTVSNVTVFLSQDPISPFVNENIKFSYTLQKIGTTEVIPNLPVQVKIVETAFNDPANDKLLETKHFTTDVNGSFSFDYTFANENYFDIDLNFIDPVSKQTSETGFLIQTRKPAESNKLLVWLFLGAVFGLGLARIVLIRKKAI